jgi:ABC-2 type transport system ATP-binding protein
VDPVDGPIVESGHTEGATVADPLAEDLPGVGELVAVGPPTELVAAHGGPRRLVVDTLARPTLPGYDVQHADRGIVIQDVDPADIGEIVAALDDAGVNYSRLAWREPDLDTAYMTLADEGRPGGDRS